MAKLLKLRRGTTTQHASFTGAEGEVTIDTTKDTAVVHDGSQAGGRPLAREDMSNVSSANIAGQLGADSIAVDKIAGGTLPSDVKIITANINDSQINNAKIGANAAIAGTKISPDFGSQDITTTGKVKFANVYSNESDLPSASTYHGMFAHVHSTGLAYYAHGGNWIKLAPLNAPDFTGGIDVTGGITATGNLTISNANPIIYFTDTNNNSDFRIQVEAGSFLIEDTTNSGADRFVIDSNGTASIAGNLDVGSGVDVTGNMTVTGTVDGRDVAADGTKLDGIESGSTADQSASEILTLIKTVDGSGSGLEADLLDGHHSTQLLKSDSADTADGDITFNGGAGAVTIAANSDIRLSNGTWSGETAGKIQHNSNILYISGGSSGHQFRAHTGGATATIDNSGNFTATGNVTAYSDARLKTDISTINDALGICGKLRGVSYKWIATDKPSIGVIAQEIEEVIPEVVLTNRETNPSTGETTEIKSVDYGKIVGVLINAINELKAEVDELKKPKKKGGK